MLYDSFGPLFNDWLINIFTGSSAGETCCWGGIRTSSTTFTRWCFTLTRSGRLTLSYSTRTSVFSLH